MSLEKRMARLRPLTLDELLARQTGISADPKNAARSGSNRHNAKARRKLADLATVIAEKLAESKVGAR